MSDDEPCDHNCIYCVTEAKCERGHLTALTVCDDHARRAAAPAIERGDNEREIVGHVMCMTGGRANPARVLELVREERRERAAK